MREMKSHFFFNFILFIHETDKQIQSIYIYAFL